MHEFVPNSGIYTIDSLYVKDELDAIYLVKQGDRLAIIDTGTQNSITQVENAILQQGLNWDNVDFIILTHVHLDHAGGASGLMALCKNAKLVVHARGARHMIDPAKLIAGTKAVYGEAQYTKMYGEITAIEETRIHIPEDNSTLNLNGRLLRFIDSPGHAYHHHCILDEATNGIFTGDAMGVCYTALRNAKHAYIFPATTPVQFNPDAMHQTIERIMALQPSALYVTHYDGVVPNSRMIAGLHEQIDDMVMLTEQCANQVDLASEDGEKQFEQNLCEQFANYYQQRCQNELPELAEDSIAESLAIDAKLNAQGLAFWWLHRRTA